MSTHTSIPWTFDRNKADGRPYREIYCGEHTPENKVCKVSSIKDVPLIAAAPKLYRELAHLVRLLEPLEKDGRLDVPGLATLNGARAALAEAQ